MAVTVLDTFSTTVSAPAALDLDASGATEGDLMVAVIGAQDRTQTYTAPSGWTLVQDADPLGSGSASGRCLVYTKVAAASETSYTWTASFGIYQTGILVEVSSSDTTVSSSAKAEVATSLTQALASQSVLNGGQAIVCVGRGATVTSDALTPTGFTPIESLYNIYPSAADVFARGYTADGSTGTVDTETTEGVQASVILVVGPGTPSVSPTGQENGFDVVATSTNTTVGNWTVKAGIASSETTRTIQSVTRINVSQVRIRLANGQRFLSGQSILVSSTADSVTDEAATNNSLQTSTTVVIPTVRGGSLSIPFTSAPTVGILASGIPQWTTSDEISALPTYTDSGTKEEGYRIVACAVDPENGKQPFHPDSFGYDATEAASFPLTMTEGQCLTMAAVLPELGTHAVSTEFQTGDIIRENSAYWRCDATGTTAGTKPAFTPAGSGTEVTDGGVTWTFVGTNLIGGDDGRTLIRKFAYGVCAGSTLKAQNLLAPAYSKDADKTFYDSGDINKALLPDTNFGVSINVANEQGHAQWPYYDPGSGGSTFAQSPSFAGENWPSYSFSRSQRFAGITRAIFSNALYTDELIVQTVQRGIEQYGIWATGANKGLSAGDGGWSQAYINLALIAAGLLEVEATWIPAMRDNGAETGFASTELGAQVRTVTAADLTTEFLLEHQFDPTATGDKTYIAPDADPATFSDPSRCYHPAKVRADWEHTPWWEISSNQITPKWNTPYRTSVTARAWAPLCMIASQFDMFDLIDSDVFFDYMDVYHYIQGPDGDNDEWDYDEMWTEYESTRPAFAFTAQAVDVAGTWFIDLNFNRYATQTNANILDQFACSGSITLSNADQTGPRTFRVQASADPRGETITYTQSATESERVVDSGNNQLPTGSTAAMNIVVTGTGQINDDGSFSAIFTRLSGLWGNIITVDNDKVTVISQTTGGTRTFTGSVIGAGTGTLRFNGTPDPPFYSVASGGSVTLDIDPGWLTDENGNTTAAYSGIDDGDNSSTQVPSSGGSVGSKSPRSRTLRGRVYGVRN